MAMNLCNGGCGAAEAGKEDMSKLACLKCLWGTAPGDSVDDALGMQPLTYGGLNEVK